MKTRKRRRRISSKWKYDKCAPAPNKKYTCYSNESLFKIRDQWNLRHSDRPIRTNEPRIIWKQLRHFMYSTCKRESCWLRQNFMKHNLNQQLRNYTFAPKAPIEWKKKPNEWLTSVDILKVMKQYERRYKFFEFIGPSPIDYDKHVSHGECVWEELCKFQLSKFIKRGISKIGIVFNTDPHDKDGSHWVALFINIKKTEIYYFDSYGERISKYINRFAKEKVIKQGQKFKLKFNFLKNKKRHQFKESECGMYCIYFIIEMIKGKDFGNFSQKLIPDNKMLALRKKLFTI